MAYNALLGAVGTQFGTHSAVYLLLSRMLASPSSGGGVSFPVADNVFAVNAVGDPTKVWNANLSGQAPGTTVTMTTSAVVSRPFRLPDISGTAVVTEDGTGYTFIGGQKIVDHGLAARVQHYSLTSGAATYLSSQYGPTAFPAGFSGFKSRSGVFNGSTGLLAGDGMVRVTALGIAPDNATISASAFLTYQVPTSFVPAAQTYLPSEAETQLTNLAGTRRVVHVIASEGETQTLSGIRAGGKDTTPGTIGTTGALLSSGLGAPEGVVLGSVGDLYAQRDGAAGTTLYTKESGANTNTGWKAIPTGATVVTNLWHLNGDLSLAPTDTTAMAGLPGNGGSATFDGAFVATSAITLTELRATLRSPGSGGTVDAEFIRYRPAFGDFFSLGIVSLGATNFATGTAAIPAGPNDVVLAGDMVICRLRACQTGNPSDLALQLTGTL